MITAYQHVATLAVEEVVVTFAASQVKVFPTVAKGCISGITSMEAIAAPKSQDKVDLIGSGQHVRSWCPWYECHGSSARCCSHRIFN